MWHLLKHAIDTLEYLKPVPPGLCGPIGTPYLQDFNQTQFPLPHRASQSSKDKYGYYIWTLGFMFPSFSTIVFFFFHPLDTTLFQPILKI